MKILILYNFTNWEKNIEAPNFYNDLGELFFKKKGFVIDYLPDLKINRFYKLLSFLKFSDKTCLRLMFLIWFIKNYKKYDLYIGWLDIGIIAALVKYYLKIKNKKLFLILYKIDNNINKKSFRKFIYNKISTGTEYLFALDERQSKYFAKILKRDLNFTCTLRYGVNYDFYKWIHENKTSYIKNSEKVVIFSPGGAHRDDKFLIENIKYFDVVVHRFLLGDNKQNHIVKKGKAEIHYYYNMDYGTYLKFCLSSNFVIICVENYDKPVGLTSLLECMALGKTVLINNGTSSRDYIDTGITGFVFESQNEIDFQEKLKYIISNPDECLKVGQNAQLSIKNNFNIDVCGSRLLKFIIN